MKKMNEKGVLSVFFICFLYFLSRKIKNSPSLPHPVLLVKSAKEIFSTPAFYINVLYTMKIVGIGVLVSFVFGVCLAVICSMNKFLNDLFMPVINATKNIPSISLFPLFIVLMGIGDFPRIVIIIWNSIYPIISSTMAGLNVIDKEIVEAAENCGAKKYQIYFYIKIPLAFTSMLNGLKISLGNGFIAIVVAEMLGATHGLGYMVLWSANTFKYSDMYIYILVIALIGFLINVVIEKIISKVEKEIYYESKKRVVCNVNDSVYDCGLYGMRKEARKDNSESYRSCSNTENEICGT